MHFAQTTWTRSKNALSLTLLFLKTNPLFLVPWMISGFTLNCIYHLARRTWLSLWDSVLFPKLWGQALDRKYRRQFCVIQEGKMGSVGFRQENGHPCTAQHWHFQSPDRQKVVKDPETNYLKNYRLIKKHPPNQTSISGGGEPPGTDCGPLSLPVVRNVARKAGSSQDDGMSIKPWDR